MPRTVPEPTKIQAGRAAEALDEVMSTRDGWTSTDRGWRNDAVGITVEATSGVSAFVLSRGSARSEFRTRTALIVYLEQAGA